jgi:competence protein ComEC
LLIAGSVWGYALLAGFEAPAVRASIMATLMLLASGTGRRPDPMTMLAIASGAMVVLNPGYVDSASFWLSVVASAAIIGRVPSGGAPTWREAWRGMAEGVLAAQVATLPIVLLLFGSWSLTSVAANVVLAPVMWLAFPMCFVFAMIVAVAPWAGPVAALPTLVPLELAIALVRTLSTSSPAFAVPQSGLPGVVGVLGPALGLALLTSRDARRWVSRASDRLVAQPLLMFVAVAGPLLGIAMAVGATLLWH